MNLRWGWVVFVVLACDRPAVHNQVTSVPASQNENRPQSDKTIYSYVDSAGNIRMVSRVEDIPKDHREQVVATDMHKDRPRRLQTDRLIVLDLRKQEQGKALNYSVVKLSGRLAQMDSSEPKDPGVLGKTLVRRWFGLEKTPSDRVILYSAPWCGFCKKAADFLRQQGVSFELRDIEKDRRGAVELQNKLLRAGLRGGGIPVLDIRGTLVIGFNKARILALLKKS